jgi:hydroxymethylpyrimidine pyrophosphatase-like HAD family hydrolase
MPNNVFVISDIDGTLVPHPFLSGKSVSERRISFERMLDLFRYENFGLMTGRREAGFERFSKEYDVPIAYPAFLGVEFGAHLAVRGQWMVRSEQNNELAQLLSTVENAIVSHPHFESGNEVENAFRKGILDTYYIELKARIAQIESHFPDAESNRIFQETVEEIVNSECIGASTLAFQSFASQRRLDVVERGFVPKSGFWPTLSAHLLPRLGINRTTVVALGDELYDSYMFRYLKTLGEGSNCSVYALAVSRPLPFADAVLKDTETALTVVVELLSGKPPQGVLERYAGSENIRM